MNRDTDIAIIVPTYNPEERMLSRALAAVAALNTEGIHIRECVIIDNNSSPAVESHAYARRFLETFPRARIVREEKQGLVHARIAGMRATTSDLMVIVDDDNVPDPDYARLAGELMRDYPTVGIWGAGTVEAEFLDPVSESLREYAGKANCERKLPYMAYGCVPKSWQPYYPIGMGQVIRRKVAEVYMAAVERGDLNATGRTGKSLASGEDLQIVWEAIKMGLAAGTHPDLRIKHLVPERRATLGYMSRVAFGTSMSYSPAFAESFPNGSRGKWRGPSTRAILKNLARRARRGLRDGDAMPLRVELAGGLGEACGQLRSAGVGQEHWAFRLATKLGFQ